MLGPVKVKTPGGAVPPSAVPPGRGAAGRARTAGQPALWKYERTRHVDERPCLNNLGWYHSELGGYRAGLDCRQQSQKLYAEVDSDFGRAVASDTNGYALAGLGRYDEAIASYLGAVDVLRGLAGGSTPRTA